MKVQGWVRMKLSRVLVGHDGPQEAGEGSCVWSDSEPADMKGMKEMRVSARLAGIAGATALGMLSMGSAAFADSADNDGTNIGNDLNTITAPTQTCGTSVVGALSLMSPQSNECVNSPLVDHPKG